MKTQACQPCAKRKVACDRQEPCSNCKRRKQDHCFYPEASPAERIKQLEALVRSLGGSPDHSISIPTEYQQAKDNVTSQPLSDDPGCAAQNQGSTNPIIANEEGQSVYLDSSSFHNWNGRIFESQTGVATGDGYPRTPVPASTGFNALQSVICRDSFIDLARRHPIPEHAMVLWDVFFQRVHPLMKISFTDELERMRDPTLALNGPHGLPSSEHAFIYAVYLMSVNHLSKDECVRLLERPKSDLIADYQMLCEQSLARSNFLGASDLTTIQASLMYITAGKERLNPRSLSSLMGALIRNAESCGLHRDGAVLGLSPYETERRRRIWWQMQHVDLALGVRCGALSLTLTAHWDTKMPLNIEDEDINPHMQEAPKERVGLTSLSPCLWTYWVVQEQRSFRRSDGSQLGFSWAADKSIPRCDKEAFLERLEKGLNNKYLQFCDPIRPRDLVIQITARSFICCMRRLTLHPLAFHGKLSSLSEGHRSELLDVCIQALEYDVALHSIPSIKHFRWRLEGYFQWSALVYVLIEARRHFDMPRVEKIWALLSDVYGANPALFDLEEDRRKSYAVELMMMAWRARESFLVDRQQRQPDRYRLPQKPAFLVNLENRLSKLTKTNDPKESSKRRLDETEVHDLSLAKKPAPAASWDPPLHDLAFNQLDLDSIADIDIDAIDWSFWNSVT